MGSRPQQVTTRRSTMGAPIAHVGRALTTMHGKQDLTLRDAAELSEQSRCRSSVGPATVPGNYI
jgi:hypothetical protein